MYGVSIGFCVNLPMRLVFRDIHAPGQFGQNCAPAQLRRNIVNMWYWVTIGYGDSIKFMKVTLISPRSWIFLWCKMDRRWPNKRCIQHMRINYEIYSRYMPLLGNRHLALQNVGGPWRESLTHCTWELNTKNNGNIFPNTPPFIMVTWIWNKFR